VGVVERGVVAENFPCLRVALDAGDRERKARGGGTRRGPSKVQLRQEPALTFQEYVTDEGWRTATLSCCPACEAPVISHGTYGRKLPSPARIARFRCAPCRMTIGMLPDFYASRRPGLLDDIEETVAIAESARSREDAAERVRPADDANAVTLAGALKWLRRRVRAIHGLLATVIGLMPARFEGCAPTIASFRERLGTTRVLVELRGICTRYLGVLAAPLGLLGSPARWIRPRRQRQQSTGPDPPSPPP
jgi:hypothetical protein